MKDKTITVSQELAIRVMSELDNNTSLLWELAREHEKQLRAVSRVCDKLYGLADEVSVEFCKLLPEDAQAQFYPDLETRAAVLGGKHG